MILDAEEKRGGRPFRVGEAAKFIEFMAGAGLFNGGSSGSRFTWCNNRQGRARIWKCLDRLLLNSECWDTALSVGMSYLAHHPSNHTPLLISTSTRLDGKAQPFRFINTWTQHEEFLGMVEDSWQQECGGSPLHILCSKLQRLKKCIQAWNKERVGNFTDNVKEVEAEVARLEVCLEEGGSEMVQLELN